MCKIYIAALILTMTSCGKTEMCPVYSDQTTYVPSIYLSIDQKSLPLDNPNIDDSGTPNFSPTLRLMATGDTIQQQFLMTFPADNPPDNVGIQTHGNIILWYYVSPRVYAYSQFTNVEIRYTANRSRYSGNFSKIYVDSLGKEHTVMGNFLNIYKF